MLALAKKFLYRNRTSDTSKTCRTRIEFASLSLVYWRFLSIALTVRAQETCFGRRSWRWLQIGGNRERINPAGWH